MNHPAINQASTPPSPKLLTVRQTAAALSVGVRTVWRQISTGELPCVRIGKAVRIPVEAVERFIERGGSR